MENGSSEEPNCMFTSGFLAGLFAEVLDRTVQARETRCISQGQPECEFEISTTEPMTEEVGDVKEPSKEPMKDTTSQLTKDTTNLPTKPPVDEAKPTKNVVPVTEPKPAPKAMSPVKDQSSQTQSPATSQSEVDAGVERASRIAKRKQGFWEKHFKKKD
jgi:outer membrane biosynthesis protein TonB